MAYTKEQIQKLFQSQFNVSTWTDFVINFFKVDTFNVVPESLDINPEEGLGYYWGDLSTKDDTLISFFYFKMNKNIDKRKVGLANLIKKYIKGIADVGIGVFDDGNHWRLSFITDMRGEKTSPKRFTFVFGDPENHYLTPVTRFVELQRKGISYANIRDAFSVEALTKQFYNDLFDWYTWALDPTSGVYFPNNPNTPEDDRDKLDTKMIRLITRLMFVWFIKQKKDANGNGLVPEGLFDPEELKLYLKEFNPQSMTSSNYYQAILQNLFFATLNRPIKTITYDKDGNEHVERRCFATNKDKPDVKSKYRYQELFKINEDRILSLFEFIPFINGGLFECLDKNKTSDGVEHAYFHDGFSRNDTIVAGHFTKRAFIPNKLFFDPENGIISIFRRYNFTVEENSPSEQQVALDPELLGKVFENLLGDYNPETKKAARNESGSFYTPREIVNYMVDISLQAYLGDTDEVKTLFADDFEYDETKKSFYEDVIKKLKAIKVLDPACGSGAFPMGMLNRIVEILQNLHAEGSKYDLKLAIMENCIFGGDIQTIAAQITKLRFFISLVCDCEKKDNPDDNFGIPNLPNLETHFVTCNSLFSLKKPQQYSLFEQDVIALKDKLKEVRHEHFTAKTTYQKTKLRNRDKELRDELAQMLKGDDVIASEDAKQMIAWNPYDQNGQASFFDSEWMFGIKEGFDIVIGNPPYINSSDQNKSQHLKEQREKLSKDRRYKTLYEKWDLYIAFLELSSCYLTKKEGVCCMIVPYPFTNQKYGLKLRKMFVEDKNLFKLVDLNGIKVFDATVFNCIPFVSNSHTLNKTMIAKGEKDDDNNLSIYDRFEQPHEKLVQDAKTQVWNLTQEKRETSRHADMHVLGDYCYVSKGMVLYSEDGLFTNEDLISDTKDIIHCREYIEAKDMDRYLINQIRFIEYNTERVPRMVSRPTFQELYDNPKLLFNCLGEMKVMIDSDQQFICQQGIRVAVPWINLNGVNNRSITNSIKRYSTLERSQMESLSKTVDLYYLLGILNSCYASVLLTNLRGGDYHIVPEHIRNIPIPLATKEQQQSIIALVYKILDAKKKDPQADTSALERKIDILVYLLYGLTYDDVKVVEDTLLQEKKLNMDEVIYTKWFKGKDVSLPSEQEMEKMV